MMDTDLLMSIIHEDTEVRTLIDVGVKYPDGTIEWYPSWPGNFMTQVAPLDIERNRERFLKSHKSAYEALRLSEPYVPPTFVFRKIDILFHEPDDHAPDVDTQE